MDEHELSDDMEELEAIEMVLDDGTTVMYFIADSVEIDGVTYLVVFEEDDEEDSFYVLKEVETTEDTTTFEELSEEEFEKVAAVLMEDSDEYELED